MNDRQEKLVAALESGEYEQGQYVLRSVKDTFCCLGVACDIYHKETGNGEWISLHLNYEFMETATRLPSEVTNWFGFSNSTGRYASGSLMDDNDKKKSFEEIAQIIRDHQSLFVS